MYSSLYHAEVYALRVCCGCLNWFLFLSSKYVRPVRGLSMCSLRRVALLCSAAVQYAYITSVYLSGDGGSADGSGVPLVSLVSSTNPLDIKTRDGTLVDHVDRVNPVS